MAEAMLAGLYSSGHPGSLLRFSEPFDERRKYMETRYPELVSARDNQAAVEGADVVVMAVKPQVYKNVLTTLGPSLLKNPSVLIISIAGGITSDAMSRWLASDSASIVRCMPNTPALISEGAVGLYANPNVKSDHRSITESIMQSIAKQVSWVQKEPLIDSVTGISGSGPAYFFLIMEAMQNAGIEAGLTPEEAKNLTLQTCVGAARMAQESDDDLATLRKKVTSPNGTTEAAIKSMENNNIRKVMEEAVFAARRRAQQLTEELCQD
ncbi:pyrroline-5-carboxylate reductase [Fennellomyces sp. T-0311]|nr:pyrroline-5-carboxylate reductase [Fennellomyces sp. T-0311]